MTADAMPTGPFSTPEECLESWFLALGPMTGSGSDHPTGIVPVESRLPHLRRLAARTSATRKAGVALPVLDAIEGLGLDLLDRLLLLALLRDALDARSNGGLRAQQLCDAAGAAGWSHQALVRSRLDTEGALRRHGLIESDGDPAQADRRYRLALRWKEPLLAGRTEAAAERFDVSGTAPGRLLGALQAAGYLLSRSAPDPEERATDWSYPFPDRPGWDAAGRCRAGLLTYATAYAAPDGPAAEDPLARLLRETGVTSIAEAALLLLLLVRGADDPPISWAVLAVALGAALPAGWLPTAATSDLVRTRLVEVTSSSSSPLLVNLRASEEARAARSLPAFL